MKLQMARRADWGDHAALVMGRSSPTLTLVVGLLQLSALGTRVDLTLACDQGRGGTGTQFIPRIRIIVW